MSMTEHKEIEFRADEITGGGEKREINDKHECGSDLWLRNCNNERKAPLGVAQIQFNCQS